MSDVKVNPRFAKNTLLLLGAAVAGPALVVAGYRYPGSSVSRAFLVGTGACLTATTYYYFDSDVRALILGPSTPED